MQLQNIYSTHIPSNFNDRIECTTGQAALNEAFRQVNISYTNSEDHSANTLSYTLDGQEPGVFDSKITGLKDNALFGDQQELMKKVNLRFVCCISIHLHIRLLYQQRPAV